MGYPQVQAVPGRLNHHPLIPILISHHLDEIENPRLQRMKTRIMAFNFTTEWVKGALNNAPDALSRYPVADPQTHEMLAKATSLRPQQPRSEPLPAKMKRAPVSSSYANMLCKTQNTSSYNLTLHRQWFPRSPTPIAGPVQTILEHQKPAVYRRRSHHLWV